MSEGVKERGGSLAPSKTVSSALAAEDKGPGIARINGLCPQRA